MDYCEQQKGPQFRNRSGSTGSDGITLPGLIIYSKSDQSFKTDQANPGLGGLTLNFLELIVPD